MNIVNVKVVASKGAVIPDGILEELYDEIGNELDPSFSTYSNALVAECTAVFEKPSEDDAKNSIKK